MSFRTKGRATTAFMMAVSDQAPGQSGRRQISRLSAGFRHPPPDVARRATQGRGPAKARPAYALSSDKLMRETGWHPQMDFETGLARTIEWYQANSEWVARVRSGAYREYYERNYSHRVEPAM